jgi:tetratricopeptide (TPR) repeat protein
LGSPIDPTDIQERLRLAHVAQREGALAEAARLCASVLHDEPDHVGALHLTGVIAARQGLFQKALCHCERALAIQPDHVEALVNRAVALRALNRAEDALAGYERVLALRPNHAEAWYNRGNALRDLGRAEEALASYECALVAQPEHSGALLNRGNALRDLNRPEEALASYARALALRPDWAEAHWNESLVHLASGDFERGWREYEWRFRTRSPVTAPRNFLQPRWRGERDIAGRTILLHAEQGLGDSLQFCRYAPMVATLGVRVVLEVQPALKPLLISLAGVALVLAQGETLPAFDLHCPLLSLPLAFDTRRETIPASVPYLAPAPDRAAMWAAELPPGIGPRVGLVWAGYAGNKNDRKRSIALSRLLAPVPAGVTFVSLQKEASAEDRALLAQRNIPHLGEALRDFADTAAVVAALDLVIAVDTAVAHLAGALGKRVFILLPFAPDWRWLGYRSDSPWYPTARLFRQPRPGDWDSVFREVHAAAQEQGGCG